MKLRGHEQVGHVVWPDVLIHFEFILLVDCNPVSQFSFGPHAKFTMNENSVQ